MSEPGLPTSPNTWGQSPRSKELRLLILSYQELLADFLRRPEAPRVKRYRPTEQLTAEQVALRLAYQSGVCDGEKNTIIALLGFDPLEKQDKAQS